MSEKLSRLAEGICPGLTSNIILTLQNSNIYTVRDLIAEDLERLAITTCISLKVYIF